MVCVDEYGKNIGTLRNLFRDLQQAVVFAKQIIEFADEEYTCVGTYKWFCEKKNEYRPRCLGFSDWPQPLM